MSQFKTFSSKDTVKLGQKLGAILRGGDVLCLSGNLGTGKTALTTGIAHSLGVEGYVTSPTFTIVNEYNSTIPFYHFDVYRVADPDEMYEIGFEEYIYGNGVVVIEWADLIKELLPVDLIWIDIKKDLESGQDVRIISVDFRGERYKGYDSKLRM